MKSRNSAQGFLVAFFSVTMAAVVFRLDTWPLTWVPMYAAWEPVADVVVRVWSRDEVSRGFRVTTLDGSTEYVNYQRLNIPRTKFIRLYYERIHGSLPAREVRDHYALSPLNRRLRELAGTWPVRQPHWDRRILDALNSSLHRVPGQPDFIMKVEASALELRFSIKDLNDGGGVTPAERIATATATWPTQCCDRWMRDDS